MGYYPWSLILASSVGGLVAALAGGYGRARLYRGCIRGCLRQYYYAT